MLFPMFYTSKRAFLLRFGGPDGKKGDEVVSDGDDEGPCCDVSSSEGGKGDRPALETLEPACLLPSRNSPRIRLRPLPSAAGAPSYKLASSEMPRARRMTSPLGMGRSLRL